MPGYIPPAIARCTDVSLAAIANGDFLTYNAATGIWSPITRAALLAAAFAPFACAMTGTAAPGASNNIDFQTVLHNSGYTVSGGNTTLQCPAVGTYQAVLYCQVDGDDNTADLEAAPELAVEGYVGTPPVLNQQYFIYPSYAALPAGGTAKYLVPNAAFAWVFTVAVPATDLFQIMFTNDLTTAGSAVSITAGGVVVVYRVG